MKVLLILKQETAGQRVVLLVALERPLLKRRVKSLMRQDRIRDVFDLAVNKGVFERYIPTGSPMPVQPDLTLIEDLL